MAKVAGVKVGMGGNIGIPALSLLNEAMRRLSRLLELSSFQLGTICSFKSVSATVLNVTEDHMDLYVDLEDYLLAKLRIYHNAKVGVLNNEDRLTLGMAKIKQTNCFFCGKDSRLLAKNRKRQSMI